MVTVSSSGLRRFLFVAAFVAALLVPGPAAPETVRYPEPLEAFELSELKLWQTYPNEDPEKAYARVRDPHGYFHRVIIGSYIGKHYGIVRYITSTEISFDELYVDAKGEWTERTTVMKKARRP